MIDPQTVALLTAHRAVCEGRCAALGVALDPDAYLFSPAPDGSTPWPPRSLTLGYGRLARKLQLRSTRLHSLGRWPDGLPGHAVHLGGRLGRADDPAQRCALSAMASECKSTVLLAFAVNLVIAIAKTAAGLLTLSSAMLAEAAYSWADTTRSSSCSP